MLRVGVAVAAVVTTAGAATSGAAAAGAATSGAAATTTIGSDFTEWKRQHGRIYATSAEAVVRFDVWASNQHSLEAARRANPHARFEADWTADWTIDELAGLRGGPLNTTGAEEQPRFDDAAAGEAGPIDWVRLGAVNAPVSQGRCGTCAQFSATADIEAQWFLHGHGLVKLSEQDGRVKRLPALALTHTAPAPPQAAAPPRDAHNSAPAPPRGAPGGYPIGG